MKKIKYILITIVFSVLFGSCSTIIAIYQIATWKPKILVDLDIKVYSIYKDGKFTRDGFKENENWEGNYIVKYWSPEWKNIIKEYQKKLDEIGVDGYLLDTVDTYQYFEENYKKILE